MRGPREMAAWSRPLDVDKLADSAAVVDFNLALPELPGLRAGVTGSVAGEARFSRSEGLAVVRLTAHGVATLECQRCLQPMSVSLESDVRIALVGAEDDVARVPEELEPMLAPGGRISIGGLITEELLLALPIVALHSAGESCAVQAPESGAEREPETHKPFARLADLLKR